MRVLVVQSSPNRGGLTAACAAAAAEGARQAGAEVVDVRLNDLGIGRCDACDDGWGTCRSEHRCRKEDGFADLQAAFRGADAYVLVTPVYWGEPSESAKALLDRLRRCEATRRPESALGGKWALCVAAAGGGGRGTLTCLSSLERFLDHVGAHPFDLIGITRRTREYKLEAIRRAAEALVACQG
ncbi:MAG: NAD(P)H-dependent oxidoreductase [Anaerolineae bacterium]|nr:NAD(P)H-dependent oxidoreductase [Anaerolineae bacterium]